MSLREAHIEHSVEYTSGGGRKSRVFIGVYASGERQEGVKGRAQLACLAKYL